MVTLRMNNQVTMRKRRESLNCVLMQNCILLCFLVFFQVSPSNSEDMSCNSGDFIALLRFFNGLDSSISGWSSNVSVSDCCSLTGVSCDNSAVSGRRVIGLDLHNKSLKGLLSDSLTNLDELILLNLSWNSLEGTVPTKLLRLQKLQKLDLSGNDLSGPIPDDLYLPSIQFFNISCNEFNGSHPILPGSRNLQVFDIGMNLFSGGINTSICNTSARIQTLRFTMNSLSGNFPTGFGNCHSIEELLVDFNAISGNLPEDMFELSSLRRLSVQGNQLSGRISPKLGSLVSLEELDLSFNYFSGSIVDVFDKLRSLALLCAHSNMLTGPLPGSLSNLSSLRVLNLRNNSLHGEITLNCESMAHLTSLDLSINSFTGPIPSSISECSLLRTLNLARNSLNGEIPDSFRSLSSLSYLSLSNNSLSNISSALRILQDVPNLTGLVLTKNFHDSEKMPSDDIQGFQNIQLFVVASCGLSGTIPAWLANCTKLKVLDLSWNRFEGSIPSWIGHLDHLFYLDLSNNSLSGTIPDSFTQIKGLIYGNTSDGGPPTDDFPFFIKRNNSGKGLQYNQVSSFPPSLFLSHNKLVGSILPGFGNLKKLFVLDLSRNSLSGTIPAELSGMSSLETLDLAYNNLTGSVPPSLTKLNFLSCFSVAFNNLTGEIPTGGQFSTFSSSDFEGNPGLCMTPSNSKYCSAGDHQIFNQTARKKNSKGLMIGMTIGIGVGTTTLLVVVYLLFIRAYYRRPDDTTKVVADSNENLEAAAGSMLVLLFQNKENKEITINDILKSTNNFDQANIVGCGGFGLVYKGTLPDGRKVAIKRLSGDFGQMEREFRAEVEALSRAQHKNLVLLQGYCRIGNDRLLIYSYMENGSLDYWLHEKPDGRTVLDWNKRLQIAQGAARGLVYLHQSCDPHILHRDIKSSNILLDENFEAHLADFGLARLILPYDTHVTTDLVGTLGYIPPEYGQSSVATFKGDVYSFGVVLLELLTGQRPVDMCKPRVGRELISWVIQMRKDRREAEVFDPCIYNKLLDRQLRQVLEIACYCLSDSPKSRPVTTQLVAWLDSIGLDDQTPK